MWNIPGTPENADVYDKYQLLTLCCLGAQSPTPQDSKGNQTFQCIVIVYLRG